MIAIYFLKSFSSFTQDKLSQKLGDQTDILDNESLDIDVNIILASCSKIVTLADTLLPFSSWKHILKLDHVVLVWSLFAQLLV